MRTAQEMFYLILETAKNDPRILAVGMNGSRTNTNVPKDSFQDFDIVYIVQSAQELVADKSWIDVFGSRLIMQTPEDMVLFPPQKNGKFTYLMLFEDGNRIDLTLCSKEDAKDWNAGDQLAEVLLDKQNLLPELPKATDKDYWIKEPTLQEFLDCCNQFWWVSTYVVKGLCRDELFYAADHLNEYCRKEYLRVLSWQIGADQGYNFSVGKNYKYLQKYLTEQQNEQILKTMDLSGIPVAWSALILLQEQFNQATQLFSRKNNWAHESNTAKQVMDYTMKQKNLYI